MEQRQSRNCTKTSATKKGHRVLVIEDLLLEALRPPLNTQIIASERFAVFWVLKMLKDPTASDKTRRLLPSCYLSSMVKKGCNEEITEH